LRLFSGFLWAAASAKKWTENGMVGSLAPARPYGRRLAPIVLAIMASATLAGSENDNAAALVGGA
jgi:hypothetical protein